MKKVLASLMLATSLAISGCSGSTVQLYRNDNNYNVDKDITIAVYYDSTNHRYFDNDYRLIWMIVVSSSGDEPIKDKIASAKLMNETKKQKVNFTTDGPNTGEPISALGINYYQTYTYEASVKQPLETTKYCFAFSFRKTKYVYHFYEDDATYEN